METQNNQPIEGGKITKARGVHFVYNFGADNFIILRRKYLSYEHNIL